ncbi:unnamed protein product [Kuraishia capsulata CBS 1993]|uniref:Uncharacterized protein n=1 Tax=Kuraishia capsulata CBS 1993 TaxID=1382522 RepID=W6MGT1_9ASCO|nr:uncharacterized protein KUCA_T00001028001 [Kuraishia capsulata CBS 1993]CDK25061.1 unnamed protein product [Kuraishia capsulata CBS 1993]
MVKTIAHIKSYPLVSELIAFLSSFAFVSYIFARLSALFSSLPANKYLYKLDEYADNRVLTSLDKTFPKITTLTSEQVIQVPRDQAVALNRRLSGAVASSVKQVEDLYTTRAKPKIDGTVNPLIEPANDRLESLLSSYLPGEAKPAATSDDAKIPKEVGRTVLLTGEIITRLKPKIGEYTAGLQSQAAGFQSHVVDTYHSEATDASLPKGVFNTAVKLSKEAYGTIRPTVEPVVAKVDEDIVKELNGSK